MREFINIVENNIVQSNGNAIDTTATVVSGDLIGPYREEMTYQQAKDHLDTYPEGILHHDIFEKDAFVFVTRSGLYRFYNPYGDGSIRRPIPTVMSWDWDTDIAELADDHAYNIQTGWWYEPSMDVFTSERDAVWWMQQRMSTAPLLEAGGMKKLAAGLGAAALLTGASAGAHAVGKMHGAEQVQHWGGEGDPQKWGEGDWFGDLYPEDEAAMKPKDAPRRPFSFLGRGKQTLVAPVSVASEDLNNLAATMWGEARSEGDVGMRAVGHVVMNRIKMKRVKWGTTVKSVVRSDKQFSCWNKGDPNREKIARMLEIDRHIASHPDDFDQWITDFQKTTEYQEYRKWRKAKKLARAILQGEDSDITGGADHYHTTSVNPFWVPTMTKIGQIGNHLFYTAKKRVAEAVDHDHHEMTCSCHFGQTIEIDENAASANMNYDLQKKYDLFNGMYFENRLPKIPLKWGMPKNVTGVVKYKVMPGEGVSMRKKGKGVRRDFDGYVLVPNSMYMVMSHNYIRDEKEFDAIFLHEMIHVWMVAVENRITENHGPNFNNMRKELSQRSGYDIPLTDDSKDAVRNPDAKIKELLVMVWAKENGDYSFAVLNKNATMKPDVLPDLVVEWARIARGYNSNVKFYIVKDAAWSGLLLQGLKEQRGKIKQLIKMSPELQKTLLPPLEKAQLIADVPPK